ncbi:hypothetical protein [Leptospira gomenensis]|uniref:hypothetical protein n=1 Tax=Leptospira gomenensis TaxID=2484974 RepID=UPI001082FF2A|nr:hypothetical protein [Leptospira gomenensis]
MIRILDSMSNGKKPAFRGRKPDSKNDVVLDSAVYFCFVTTDSVGLLSFLTCPIGLLIVLYTIRFCATPIENPRTLDWMLRSPPP